MEIECLNLFTRIYILLSVTRYRYTFSTFLPEKQRISFSSLFVVSRSFPEGINSTWGDRSFEYYRDRLSSNALSSSDINSSREFLRLAMAEEDNGKYTYRQS